MNQPLKDLLEWAEGEYGPEFVEELKDELRKEVVSLESENLVPGSLFHRACGIVEARLKVSRYRGPTTSRCRLSDVL